VQNEVFLRIMLASIEVVNMTHPTLSPRQSEIDSTEPTDHQGLPHFEPLTEQGSINRFDIDHQLQALMRIYLEPKLCEAIWPAMQKMGALAGGPLDALAHDADHHPPVLSHRERNGHNKQRIDKHPAYQTLEKIAFGQFGLAAMNHRAGIMGADAPWPPIAKYLLSYLFVQSEFGLCCPLSMTDSLTRTLSRFGSPELVEQYLPALTSTDLDELAQGAMFMTEQGAGSDVAHTASIAYEDSSRAGLSDESAQGQSRGGQHLEPNWRLYGEKWFCSNPDADLAMVLARTGPMQDGIKAVSLFLMPKCLPNGQPNHYRIVRLKDKLGSRSMASGEISLLGARAFLIGEAGRGFVQMADMVNNSRLSNGMRAAGMMRRAAQEAWFFAQHRRAFGKTLAEMPLMQRQLMKIRLPAEQALSMMFQAAQALKLSDDLRHQHEKRRAHDDLSDIDSSDAAYRLAYGLTRLLTPLIKFRACRDARKVCGDAMEVRGGCGYIEEWADARLLRDAHLGSIWEGTSNIVALDVMRAIKRDAGLEALDAHSARLVDDIKRNSRQDRLLASLSLWEGAQTRLKALVRVAAFEERDDLARKASSALYNSTTALFMLWEASQMQEGAAADFRNAAAAQVIRNRLLGADPLHIDPPYQNDYLYFS
jgi:acyl-CoA dehydrogenase